MICNRDRIQDGISDVYEAGSEIDCYGKCCVDDLTSKGEINKSVNIICSGFGIGLSWGVASFEIDNDNIIPIIQSDDYYKEAYKGAEESYV